MANHSNFISFEFPYCVLTASRSAPNSSDFPSAGTEASPGSRVAEAQVSGRPITLPV
jgi:hypothetical protein